MNFESFRKFYRKNKRDVNLAIIVTVIASIFFVLIVFDYIKNYYPELIYDNLPEIQVTIPRGVNAKQVARILQNAGIVHSAKSMSKYMVKYGLDKKIQYGTYKLRRASAKNVATQLLTTQPVRIQFTIIPGTALCDLENMFERKYKQKNALYKAMADKTNFPKKIRGILPKDVKSRFIFLFPDTYYANEVSDLADEVVRLASIEWAKKVLPLLKEKHLTNRVLKLGVLASIVEVEAMFDDERPTIAGVLHNRLSRGKPLQCDTTVTYAWKIIGVEKKRLSYKDVTINSPYNTYKNKGLPPMAICIPSLPSWKAAISPHKTDYLYFYSKPDGHTLFAKTYKEHLRNQR